MLFYKKKNFLKEIFIYIAAAVFTYFSVVSFLYCKNYSEAKKNEIQVEIIVTGEKNNLSKGYEARILEIEIDNEKQDLSFFALNGEEFLYKEGMLIGYQGKLIISLKESSTMSLIFLKHSWSGIVEIQMEVLNKKEKIDLFDFSDNTYEYQYLWNDQKAWENAFCLRNINKLGFISLYFFLYLICLICLKIVKKFLLCIKTETLSLHHLIWGITVSFIMVFLTIYVLFYLFREWCIGIILIIVFSILIKNREVLERNIQYGFVILYIPFAILFIFLLPPGHVPDEFAHFVKNYEVSIMEDSHVTLKDGFEEQGYVYIYLPKSIKKLQTIFMINVQDYNVKYDIKNYYDCYLEKLNKNDIAENIYYFGNTKKLSIISYIPGIAVEILLNWLNFPPLLIIQIIRFINMIIVCILGYYTILFLPFYKRLFLFIMLLPVTIQQSIGINQDWMINSISFFTIAYILQIREKDLFEKRDFILLCFLSFLLGSVKIVYVWTLFFVFTIPCKKFLNRKYEYSLKFLILLPGVLASFFSSRTMLQSLTIMEEAPFYEMDFIFKHPLQTAKIYINTFLEYGMYHFSGGLITGFGWYTHYSRNFISGIIGNLLALLLISADEYKERKLQFISIFIFFMISIFIYTALFLGWTTEGSNIVAGLQPRYFIIPLLCFGIGIQNRKICFINVMQKNFVYLLCIFGILCSALWTIALGFYY